LAKQDRQAFDLRSMPRERDDWAIDNPDYSGDSDEDEDEDWTQHVTIDNSIWRQMKSSGIDLRKMKRPLGWMKGWKSSK
jgi:hypothetical protein